jgi:uncharacterized membrane protein
MKRNSLDGMQSVWHKGGDGAGRQTMDVIAWIALAVVAVLLWRRTGRLEREVARLHDRLIAIDRGSFAAPSRERVEAPVAAEPEPEVAGAEAPVRAAAYQAAAREPVIGPEPEIAREAEIAPARAAPPPPDRGGLETLVGGRLPIWIGGAALVLSAFFLVRYSIESGLLGPAARVVLGALFSAALVGASEVARRWAPTRDDPRIGQVLAGAGVASAYGTLYVAAALYDLVGAGSGFALMIGVTAIALVLALRHGPPTAIMALVGGFAAPLVAGVQPGGVGPLLAYLALFVAALFGLAVKRGWTWLALATTLFGLGWANVALLLLDGRDAAGVAAFVCALAVGASLAVPRTGEVRTALRLAPMVGGLLQLMVLAPSLDFSAMAWGFELVTAAAALVLARLDERMRAGALAAAVLTCVLIGAGFGMVNPGATPGAAVVATLLFGGAGLAFSRAERNWAWVAVIGLAVPVLAGNALASRLLVPAGWAGLELALAVAAAGLVWRHRDRAGESDVGLIAGGAAVALLAGVGLANLLPPAWVGVAAALAVLALAGWSRRMGDAGLARLPGFALVAALLIGAEPIAEFLEMLLRSAGGERLTWPLLPGVRGIVTGLMLPAAAGAAALAIDGASFGKWRREAAAVIGVLAVAAVYACAKQLLAIGSPERFVALGFGERAAITLALAGAGWGLERQARFVRLGQARFVRLGQARFVRLGQALAALAAARFLWFDLGVFSPVVVEQAVGGWPIVNWAVLLPGCLAALWIRDGGWRRKLALVATVIAGLAAVRQASHGTLLTGPVGSGETWGYSAVLLGLGLGWVAWGMRGGARDLRAGGLLLVALATAKVFLLDVAALGGLLRILAFMGLGVALIGLGWAYGRVMRRTA